MLTVGSLFAGIGGLELGLERTGGFKTVWQVELDEYARRVLAKHWPDVRRWDDVKTFPSPAWVPCECCGNFICTWHEQHAHDCDESECPELEVWDYDWGLNPYEQPHPKWNCDIIVGGDPCQANSAAGRSRKESLGGEFLRVVEALRPRLVLRENPANTRADAPWPWWRFRQGLESLGYAVLPFRLRACCVGAQHERERLFLLAEDTNTQSDRLEGRDSEHSERRSQSGERIQALVDDHNGILLRGPRGYRSRNGLPNLVDRLRCLGNAVVPQVAEFIGNMILDMEAHR